MVDVTLPDGTILRGIPDSMSAAEQEEVVRQYLADNPAPTPTEPYVDEQGVTRYPNLQQVESGAFEDIVGAGLAGMARGVKGLAETPEMLGRAVIRGGQELAQLAGAEVQNEMPVLDTATGRGIEAALSTFGGDKAMAYRGESTPAQFAGTIGEFVSPAGIIGGGKKLLTSAVAAGTASEAAGQATEGTAAEPYARAIGAIAGGYSPAALAGIKNKTVLAFEKNAKYDYARKLGAEVKVDMDGFNSYVNNSIKNAPDDLFSGYTPGVDTHIDNALKVLSSRSGSTLNQGQMEAVRTSLKSIYARGQGSGEYAYDPRVGFIIDKLDEAMDQAPAGISGQKAQEAFKLARAENRRFRKIEMFEDMMKKADLDAGQVGTSASLVDKQRNAMRSIIKSPSRRAQFEPSEIQVMDAFVRGTIPEKVMRVLGKFSPTTGNPVTAFMNLGAIYFNPPLIAASLGAIAARSGASISASNQFKKVKDQIVSGLPAKQRKLITDKDIMILLGLQAE
jgi:hypothetical protein